MAHSHSVVTDSVVTFLKAIPPFQFVPLPELVELSKHTSLEYFPKETVILSAGRRAADSLYVIQKGGVKLALRTQVGKELILDMRSEGELFGLMSLMSGDVSRLDVTTVEDTLCYSIPAEQVQRLMSKHAEVGDYLVRTSVRRYMDRSLHELRAQTHLMGDAERLLYTLNVDEVAKRQVIMCAPETSIREAACLVARAHSTCLIVTGDRGQAIGIVTDRDFTNKVVAQGTSSERTVAEIMSAPVVVVEHSALVFQALLEMLTHGIQHVLVVERGVPKSVLTTHDLTLLQGKSPLSVARHLEQQADLKGLAEAQKRIADLMPLLLREGAKASHITQVLAEINDRLLLKIFEFAHQKLGPAPVPYCWVVLGSEARREQTFKTDQDNALIYADSSHPRAESYVTALAEFVCDALQQCGYPPCPGGFMATNPNWRQPLAAWKARFENWIAEAELHATEDALILLDMRAGAGDHKLFEELRRSVRDSLKKPEAGFFKSILASITVEHKPPLGFFRTFVVERDGEHKQELDLKMLGTGPIVNAARLFVLDKELEGTSTVDRLAALENQDCFDSQLLRDIQQAFEFLTMLRLEQQLQRSRTGQAPSNYVRPEKLTHLQRAMLKETFHTIGRMQSVIDQRFRTAVWQQMGR
jgi:CBS domain-containing protein